MGELDKIATTGFSKMSDRQVGVWDTGNLGNVKTITLDQSAGVVMPFWTDNNILFLAGKGDGNIRYYEYESGSLFALAEHKSTDPQRGMCFLPRRALSVADCEIARGYKVQGSSIEPIAFIVPRKADSFQSDIFPPAPSIEPSLSAAEFFNGKVAAVKLVNLSDGSSLSGPRPGAIPSALSSSLVSASPPSPAPISATRSYTASAPSPGPVPPPTAVTVSEPPPTAAPTWSDWVPSQSPIDPPSRSQSYDVKKPDLEAENARLESELFEAREKIRNLELQVEAIRANARKAAQTLLNE
jgi:coronin-1B/1C/6